MDWKAKLLLALVGSFDGLKTNVLMPILARAGTATTVWLAVTLGADAKLAEQVAAGVIAFGLIMFDLLVSWMNRKAAIRRAIPPMYSGGSLTGRDE